MNQLNIEYIDIEKLIPYINNPRHNERAVDAVAGSIAEYGFKNPIIVDKDNVIIAGHTRLLAARKLELREVPIIRAEDLTEKQVKGFRIADNKTAELSEWDIDLLAIELSDLGELFTGFSEDELEELTGDYEVEEDDYEPELPDAPRSRYGQVYQLGSHCLMCGDSTKKEDIKKLMNGVLADVVITDPPYNVNYEGGTDKKLTIQNDNQSTKAFLKFLTNAFESADTVLKQGGAFYIWHADAAEGISFRQACGKVGWQIRQNLIWVKNALILGRQDYQWRHEACLYGWKDGAAHYFTKDRTQDTVIDDQININTLKKEEMKELLKALISDHTPSTIIYEDKPARNDVHPTMKPVKLMARLVHNSTRKEEIILDPFGGSGSTMIACEQLNRSCYTCELDPKYVDVIINRWEAFTGGKAVLISE